MMKLPKWIARRPIEKTERYLKYGFVITECERYDCPRCGCALNAGPNYQPGYCSQCGQKINFRGTEWKPARELGFAERREENESVENRVVRPHMESDNGLPA